MSGETVVIQKGTWLYDGAVSCLVHVEQRSLAPGSGDHDDPPEVRKDREGIFFYACYNQRWSPSASLAKLDPSRVRPRPWSTSRQTRMARSDGRPSAAGCGLTR
jgi:hypothetical protein